MRQVIFIGLCLTVGLFSSCGEDKTKSSELSKVNYDEELVNLNEGWAYYEGSSTIEEITKIKFLDEIDLPHSWNTTDAVDAVPGYRRDQSWYKKVLSNLDFDPSMSYNLYFEGANMVTDVYVNGKRSGGHVGGYVGFDVNITDQMQNGDNEILISVHNRVDRELIPSQKSDFFLYGGITRDLWLEIKPRAAFKDFFPQIVHKSDKTFDVKIEVTGESSSDYKLAIMDGSEELVSQKFSGTTAAILDFDAPELWSIDNPKLYSLMLSQLKGDEIVHTEEKTIGFRYTEFKEGGAFFLNGERVLIRGTHRHEEHAGLAAAMTNEMHYNDIKMIKDMGANFVRLAHYPQDPEVYKACNELGLLVWDELPWCRGGLGNDVWKANTLRLLDEQIHQNMHHPSIIMWSMGNEMYWDEDFEGGGAIEPLRDYLTQLCTKSKEIDPTRPTCIRKFYEGADLVDVFSPSIWAGWYRGKYGEYEEALDDSRKKYPRFVHMEYGCAAHKGRHDEKELSVKVDGGWEEDPSKIGVSNMAKNGTWSETYAVDLFDWHLHVSENRPGFTGNAQWAFKDFGTPLRPENPIPYINQKGIADRAGNLKDSYYVFKSYWNKTDPFVYIQSHTWTTRFGAVGEKKSMRVYSNCNEVTLSLNGEKLEARQRNEKGFPAHGFVWEVELKAGKNELSCRGTLGDKVVHDKLKIDYFIGEAGKADRIVLKKETVGDLIMVTANVVDKEGVICQDYRDRIYFDINGAGEFIKDQGTNDGSEIIEPMSGTASIFVKGASNGETVVECRNQDFKGAYLKL